MKRGILLILVMFLVAPFAYSQHVKDAMPVDIPLNSTKEAAVQKLLRYNYRLWDSYEEDGFKVLEYKGEYNKKVVKLWLRNNTVSFVSWKFDPIYCSEERNAILRELKDVYELEPYAEVKEVYKYSYYRELYFRWKGNTIIVGGGELYILSNADAAKKYQKETQEIERREQERIEKERLEQEKKERERQEQIRRENELLEKKRREEHEAHVKELISNYMPCRFLFVSIDHYATCITQESQSAIENEIKTLIDLKMVEVSNVIVKGTEFKDNSSAKNIVEGICEISRDMRTVDPVIAFYAEKKLENFITNRGKLNKAYNKAKKKAPGTRCSDFLISYINNDGKDKPAPTNSIGFLMFNADYSIAPQTAFGLTMGSMKKFGWYVSLNNGRPVIPDILLAPAAEYECDYSGTISNLTTSYSYSGNKKTSRFGATAGIVYKISDPVCGYGGIGYGLRNVYWELENGEWAKCTDDSTRGISFDAGIMMHFGEFSLSLGVQTIGIKYMEAKIGAGFNFELK